MSGSETPVLRLPVSIDAVRNAPQSFAIEADARDREALKAAYGLLAVDSLAAQGTLTRVGRFIELRGTVEAKVSQACVVTLEPVEETVREEISIDFLEPGAKLPETHAAAHGEDDPPEVLEGDEIDVGALVEEHFVLGLDPYPRRPGVEVPQEYRGGAGGSDSPFAALSGLSNGAPGTDNRRKSKD